MAVGRVRGYSSLVGNLRLIARGISPQVGNAVAIEEVDVASARQRAASWFSFIPMIVIIAAFVGGMNVAIDATAGERERQSLEPLLVNPVPRRTLAMGKWLAASVFSAAGVGIALASVLFALSRVPLQQLGIELQIGPREAIGLLIGTLPLALFAAGLQVLLSTFARSYKEAQGYLSMLMMLPMIPHFIASMSSLGDAWWMLPIPALGQHVLLTDVLGGESVSVGAVLAVVLASPLLGYACVEITARLFERERIVFGR
jgi:sodium transport system permease protein